MYDFLIVGAGLSGATITERLLAKGKKVLLIEKRREIGGNIKCENVMGIICHRYGAHIFRTDDKQVWEYVNRFAEFNNFINSPIANYNGEIYNLPFNMNTFIRMFGTANPDDACEAINRDKVISESPTNLEEHALNMVGKTVYEKLIKEYTEKQWGMSCKDLPPDVMKRIPMRFTYDNNYYRERYQGVPVNGYNEIIEKMVDGADIITENDYNKNREMWRRKAGKVVYTGPIDALYDYKYGALEYRGLRFRNEIIQEKNNYQGVAVVNYTSKAQEYTRIIEHKHFVFGDKRPFTVITKEYPEKWEKGKEPYYPVPTKANIEKYNKYRILAEKDGYILCGRLAEYKYFDMQDTIKSAIEIANGLE